MPRSGSPSSPRHAHGGGVPRSWSRRMAMSAQTPAIWSANTQRAAVGHAGLVHPTAGQRRGQPSAVAEIGLHVEEHLVGDREQTPGGLGTHRECAGRTAWMDSPPRRAVYRRRSRIRRGSISSRSGSARCGARAGSLSRGEGVVGVEEREPVTGRLVNGTSEHRGEALVSRSNHTHAREPCVQLRAAVRRAVIDNHDLGQPVVAGLLARGAGQRLCRRTARSCG